MRYRFNKPVHHKHTYNAKNSKQSKVKWTDKAGIVIQAISVILTFALFYVVIEQNKISTERFDAENAPFLQIDSIRFQMDTTNKIKIGYTLFNLGKYPAKILNARMGTLISRYNIPENPIKQLAGFHTDTIHLPYYINNERPFNGFFGGWDVIEKNRMDSINKGKLHLCFFGEIVYINKSNNSKMYYDFNFRFYAPPKSGYIMIYNENVVFSKQ